MSDVIQHVDSWKNVMFKKLHVHIPYVFLHGRFMHADDAQPILDLLTQILGAESEFFFEKFQGEKNTCPPSN